MISKLSIHGYKSLLDVNLKPAKLNILVGANACGKSSVLQALLLLRQSIKSGAAVSTLELSGGLFEAGTTRDILNPEARSGIYLSIEAEHSSETTFAPEQSDNGESRELKTSTPLQLPLAMTDEAEDSFGYLSAERIGPRVVYQLPMPGFLLAGPVGMHGEYTTAYLARCQLGGRSPYIDWYELLSKAAEFMPEDLNLDAGSRTNFARLDLVAKQVLSWVLPGAEFDAIEQSVTDSARLSFVRDPSGTRSSVRPTHMGFGITYTLPVIAAALSIKNSGLLLIENPEAHLHPLSQSRIGTFLALAASKGPQIFVETHSDHVVNGIRLAVKGGLIEACDVQFMYFRKRLQNDSTYVTELSVLDNGSIESWPEGFFDQIVRDLSRL